MFNSDYSAVLYSSTKKGRVERKDYLERTNM